MTEGLFDMVMTQVLVVMSVKGLYSRESRGLALGVLHVLNKILKIYTKTVQEYNKVLITLEVPVETL